MKIKYKYNTSNSENSNSIIDYLLDIITLNGPEKHEASEARAVHAPKLQ